MIEATKFDTPAIVKEHAESSSKKSWYALYARSRHEKILHHELFKKGIASFLPLRRITRHWSDRKKIIEEPLFKGYLFVQIPWIERWRVLNSVGAVTLVGMRNTGACEVPEKDILALQKFVAEDITIDHFPYLKKGERVYIRSGPFKGAEGFILYKNQKCRLVISLDMLMQSVSIEVDEACVEPV